MRKLASIQRILDIQPIEKADRIETVSVLGWKVVVPKGQFKVNDYCVYFEIDSLLPDEQRYKFLQKSSWNKRYSKVRLKTIQLRGQISQGLVLPLKEFPDINFSIMDEGDDLTEILKIEKYEPVVPAQMGGNARRFTWPIAKTGEERVQSNPATYLTLMHKTPYQVTLKLDGTSATFLLMKANSGEMEYHVCSRNCSLTESDNVYWQMGRKYNIEEKLRESYEENGTLLAFQGEIVGPGIQANRMNLSEVDLYIFNVVDVASQQKLPIFYDAQEIPAKTTEERYFGIPTVPLIKEGEEFPYTTVDSLLELSEGKYKEHFPNAMPDQEREGIVIRSKDHKISFKVINNRFLLRGGDEV